MKKFLRFSLVALFAVLGMSNAMAEEIIWSEDFSSYSADDVPSGGDYSYVCANGKSDTKIYAEALAGGKSPELLVGKKGSGKQGTFTATIPLNGKSGSLTLSYMANYDRIEVTATGATLGDVVNKGNNYVIPVTVESGTESITLTFSNITTSNVRLDDIKLYQGTAKQNPGLSWGKAAAKVTFGDETSYDSYLPKLKNPNNLSITCTSSDETVATVTNDGEISVLAVGETTLTASYEGDDSYDSQTVTCVLTVNANKTNAELAFSPEEITITFGETFTAPTLSNPHDALVEYSSNNTDVAEVDESTGAVTIKAAGTAKITAKVPSTDETYTGSASYTLIVNEAGGDPVDPEIATVNTFPYEEAFSNSLGKFYIKDVTLPEGFTYIWAKNNSYVKASAYKSGIYASESWLISPYIDLTSATAPVFTFNHALNKFNSVDEMKEQATLWIKEKDGDWTQLSGMNYTENNDWTFISAGEFDLSSYKGKTIQIGFKYVSTTASAGTWEIKEFALTDGEEDPNVKGGENNPYTVEEIMAFDPDNTESLPATKVWVKGYIAGCVNTEKGNELSTGDAVASNLALSSTGVVTSVIPVQLPTGAVRTALNVADNAGNVGKEVLVYGNIQKYCGVAGVKNTSDYKFTGNSTEITGISALTIDTDVNAPMYNLKGERVDANYRGVVIKGGKKTIQK